MPIALLLILLLGGGTSLAAQESLPGDVLYPIKIHVNENIESMLAVSAKSDAAVDEKQAARRVDEAESLKTAGLLTPELSNKIRDSFESKIVRMNKHLNELQGKGDTQFISELNNKLEVQLEDHFEVFTQVSANATNTPTLFKIFQNVDERHNRRGRSIESEKGSSSTSTTKMEDGEDDEVRNVINSKNDNNKNLNIGKLQPRDDDEGDEEEDDDDVRNVQNINNAPIPVVAPPVTITTFTSAQVATHNKSSDCYSVVNGSVYDLTSWIKQHPGGQSAIVGMCGVDATQAFTGQHGGQGRPESELASFKIGTIK